MYKIINNVLEMKITLGTSLAVQSLRLGASTAGGVCSIPDGGAKVLCATVQPKKEKKDVLKGMLRLREVVKGRKAWGAAVHGVAESDTTEQLNRDTRPSLALLPLTSCR